jgi:hypothetical protein
LSVLLEALPICSWSVLSIGELKFAATTEGQIAIDDMVEHVQSEVLAAACRSINYTFEVIWTVNLKRRFKDVTKLVVEPAEGNDSG